MSMTDQDLQNWLRGEVLYVDNKAYIFPHGAQFFHKKLPKTTLTRDVTAECPNCSNVWLYTNVYSKCYNCGLGIIDLKDDSS